VLQVADSMKFKLKVNIVFEANVRVKKIKLDYLQI